MVKVPTFLRIQAMPGKEAQVEELLTGGPASCAGRTCNPLWFGLGLGHPMFVSSMFSRATRTPSAFVKRFTSASTGNFWAQLSTNPVRATPPLFTDTPMLECTSASRFMSLSVLGNNGIMMPALAIALIGVNCPGLTSIKAIRADAG